MAVYTVNDQQIHVWEQGRPGRTVALLIHGWSSSHYALSPLLPLLSRSYHCLSVELPGYGESPAGQERATMVGYADLIAGLLKQVTDKPALLVDHSMGGRISLHPTLHHHEHAERLVLLCPTISGRLSLFINLFVLPIVLMERFPIGTWIVSLFESQMVGLTDQLMRPASFAEQTGITEESYKQLRADARHPGQGR